MSAASERTDPTEIRRAEVFRRWVPEPVRFPRIALAVLCAGALMVCGALWLPWQQSVRGAGRVIAYAPVDRQQAIEAPFDGRIVRWHVQEGSHVEHGALLVDIADLDPELLSRLEVERTVTEERLQSYRERMQALRERVASVERTQLSAVRANESRVKMASDRKQAMAQGIVAAIAERAAATANAERHRGLVAQGLVSQRELEVALAAETRADTNLDVARAQDSAAQAELDAARASVEQARAHAQAEADAARAALSSAETDVQGAQNALIRIESRLARQHNQHVRAPRSGTVFRILAADGSAQVKGGDPLVLLVPDSLDRAAEIYIDGNDAALVQPGAAVRIQFEGWPAVQFVGWPSVAVGTFPAQVAFVDSHDDGRGNFRVVVAPVNASDWPEPRYLRQGVRANGWVLLNQVRVGFELWRLFNGFPPTVTPPSTGPMTSTSGGGKSSAAAGDGDEASSQ